MKSFVGIFLLLTIFATTALGAKLMGNFSDPQNPGKCTFKSRNLVLSPGEVVKDPTGCARIRCGNDGFGEIHTCGAVAVAGCTLGDYIDKSLPYPECCKRHVICN